MVLLITYDLKRPGQNYSELYQTIKSLGTWWHYLESTWLVDTFYSPQQAWESIAPKIDQNDRLLIVEITGNYKGWLTRDAWDWINTRKR